MKELHNYFTLWTLIVSYSIFILCILFNKKIPLWVLLFAACLLTSTSIIGTFFHTVANIDTMSKKKDIKKRKIFLYDIVCHSGPLLVFLLFFSILVKRTSFSKYGSSTITKNFLGRKCSPLESDYFFLTIIPAIILMSIYLITINPDFVYKDDNIDVITKVVLSIAIFCSSYQIYFNWSRVILNF